MPNPPLPKPLVDQLNTSHATLLALHKSLLDHERPRYEALHGTIPSPHAFLNLLLNDPFFNWLRTLSGIITQIDEALSLRNPPTPAEAQALLTQTQNLLTNPTINPAFYEQYARALQDSPEVTLAHAQWKSATNPPTP